MKIQLTDTLHIVACMFCAFLCSVIIAHATPHVAPCIVGGFLGGMCLGIGKEFGDSRATGNSWSWSDMLFNLIGSAIGCLGGFTANLIHI